MSTLRTIEVPFFALVTLIGPTGAGKSTLASRSFAGTEIISSDQCRAMIADNVLDQSVSEDAFAVVQTIAERRLKNRRFTVIDATNVRPMDREIWVRIARAWLAPCVAVIVDPGLEICLSRTNNRTDRDFGSDVPERMYRELHIGLSGIQNEGFDRVWHLTSAQEIESARFTRTPPSRNSAKVLL